MIMGLETVLEIRFDSCEKSCNILLVKVWKCCIAVYWRSAAAAGDSVRGKPPREWLDNIRMMWDGLIDILSNRAKAVECGTT